VQRAYEHYVERIGMRPGPMDADYDAIVRDGHAWVADDGGAIAGLLVLEAHGDHLLIENVAVEPARQGQGAGSALLAFAEERARELGLRELRLYTHVKMTENQALYARLGYREDERRSEQGFARVFMSKRLGK
jgi:ribosomal protein S18 acetylase RimI-like enzyme